MKINGKKIIFGSPPDRSKEWGRLRHKGKSYIVFKAAGKLYAFSSNYK
jgi:hypothetical protein